MNIAPRYLGRGSWLARRDPRVLILVVVLFIFTVLQVWDARLLLVLLAIAIVYYRTGNIPWAQIRRNWTVVFVFIGSLVLVNLVIAGVFAFLGGLFAVLFTGEYPEGIRNFLVGVYRYGLRVEAYVGLLTDTYPPFRMAA